MIKGSCMMTTSDFLKLYSSRSQNLMWFLGAGASASSGIPTAWDMIWDFKRTIYCAEQKVPVRACEDLSNPQLRQRIDEYLGATGRFPAPNCEVEYAELFLNAHPDESDRRRFIDRMVSQATPSYGHLALAALASLGKTRITWTTNFDRNVEDAAAKVFGTTGRLTVATLDSSRLASETLLEERWPILVKIHGDFQSRRLKNTSEELLKQDEDMRRCLTDASKRFGMVILGYSGRDASVMSAMEDALLDGAGFPEGLFWVCRPGSPPYPRAIELIGKARQLGISAHLIESPSFDEFMADVLLMEREIGPELLQHLDSVQPRISDAPTPSSDGGWPVIRLNALPLTSYPTLCRSVVCEIGGQKEVRAAVKESGRNVLAVRRKNGVLAFGSDSDIRAVFAQYQITGLELHSIERDRLGFDSMESNLMNDALVKSIVRQRGLVAHRRNHLNVLAINHKDLTNSVYDPLRQVCKPLAGKLPKEGIAWSEALTVRLELRQQHVWLLFEPTTWIESLPGRRVSEDEKEFHRERAARRYNKVWNQLLESWAQVLTAGQKIANLKAFDSSSGVDAEFVMGSTTAFSRYANDR